MRGSLKQLVSIEYGNGLYPAISNRLADYAPPDIYYRFGSVRGLQEGFHTFVDDWRLESIWRDQDKLLDRVIMHKSAMLPDYTVEKNYPYALTVYQIWRSRVIGRWWQDHGVMPIPVLQWGNPDYYQDVFKGLDDCEIVAVRGPSRGFECEWRCAVDFYLETHQPKLVLHFGRRDGIELWANVKHYPLKG